MSVFSPKCTWVVQATWARAATMNAKVRRILVANFGDGWRNMAKHNFNRAGTNTVDVN